MRFESAKDYGAMSAIGASIIFDEAMERLSHGERYNLGLATGNTMIELYDQLAAKFNAARADLSLLSTWNLDEYSADGKSAVPHDHPLSYWKYMHEMLFSKFDPALGFREENAHFSDPASKQNTKVTAGGDAALVPRYAATMGMAPILAAKKCLLLACFEEQAAPLKAIIARNGEPTPFLAMSSLRSMAAGSARRFSARSCAAWNAVRVAS